LLSFHQKKQATLLVILIQLRLLVIKNRR